VDRRVGDLYDEAIIFGFDPAQRMTLPVIGISDARISLLPHLLTIHQQDADFILAVVDYALGQL
jgi:hypothetical protein